MNLITEISYQRQRQATQCHSVPHTRNHHYYFIFIISNYGGITMLGRAGDSKYNLHRHVKDDLVTWNAANSRRQANKNANKIIKRKNGIWIKICDVFKQLRIVWILLMQNFRINKVPDKILILGCPDKTDCVFTFVNKSTTFFLFGLFCLIWFFFAKNFYDFLFSIHFDSNFF